MLKNGGASCQFNLALTTRNLS